MQLRTTNQKQNQQQQQPLTMKITTPYFLCPYWLVSNTILVNAFSIRPGIYMKHNIIKMQSTTNNEAESILTQLNGISSSPDILRHETFLLDMWGVMHDGNAPYDGVLDTVQELKRQGKKLIILSNSSKRRDASEKMLKKRELNYDG